MNIVLDINTNNRITLQRQLFDQLRQLILEGKLRGGDAVPSSRMLSKQLDISRNTVVMAYDLLICEGYIESRPNIGTFVCQNIPEQTMQSTLLNSQPVSRHKSIADQKYWHVPRHQVISPNRNKVPFDFWAVRSDPASFPIKQWNRISNKKIRGSGSKLTEYSPPYGLAELRQSIANHLGPSRGISVSREQVIIVGGSQDGLNLIAYLLKKRICSFIHEDPCYQGAVCVFINNGYKTIGIPVDNDGIDVSKLPNKSCVLYLTPSHQYPLGVTLPLEKRFEILAWAKHTDSFIIEDDYDGDFRYEGAPLTALRGLDNQGRVLYLGTFSKSLGAGLRLGYLVVPVSMIKAARNWKAVMSNGTAWLEQSVMSSFMDSGGYNRHLRRIRTKYKSRRDQLISSLHQHFEQPQLSGTNSGMHLCWHLSPKLEPASVIARFAIRAGIGVYTVSCCGAWISAGHPRSNSTLIFGYAALSENKIRQAIRILSNVIEENVTVITSN